MGYQYIKDGIYYKENVPSRKHVVHYFFRSSWGKSYVIETCFCNSCQNTKCAGEFWWEFDTKGKWHNQDVCTVSRRIGLIKELKKYFANRCNFLFCQLLMMESLWDRFCHQWSFVQCLLKCSAGSIISMNNDDFNLCLPGRSIWRGFNPCLCISFHIFCTLFSEFILLFTKKVRLLFIRYLQSK